MTIIPFLKKRNTPQMYNVSLEGIFVSLEPKQKAGEYSPALFNLYSRLYKKAAYLLGGLATPVDGCLQNAERSLRSFQNSDGAELLEN